MNARQQLSCLIESGPDQHGDLSAGRYRTYRGSGQQHITEAVESGDQDTPSAALSSAHHDLPTWRRTAARRFGATAATTWA
jgi:hypothetical protein